jgi:hypothetical protein
MPPGGIRTGGPSMRAAADRAATRTQYKSTNNAHVMWCTLIWLLIVNCENVCFWKMCVLKMIHYGRKMLIVSKLKTCLLCSAVMLNYIRMVITLKHSNNFC